MKAIEWRVQTGRTISALMARELIAEVERLRAFIVELKYPCGHTFTEETIGSCKCWACQRNTAIDAALGSEAR